MLTIYSAQLTLFFLESASWGIHSVVFLWALYTLVDAKTVSGFSAFWGVTLVATAMWLVGTLDMGTDIYISFKLFIAGAGLPPFSNIPPSVILESVGVNSEISLWNIADVPLQQVNLPVQCLLGDAFLVRVDRAELSSSMLIALSRSTGSSTCTRAMSTSAFSLSCCGSASWWASSDSCSPLMPSCLIRCPIRSS